MAVRFTFGGETFDLLDITAMTFVEASAACKAAKITMKDLGDPLSTPDAFQASVWVSMKRRKPELKYADLNDVPIGEIFDGLEEVEEPDPTKPEPPANSDSST